MKIINPSQEEFFKYKTFIQCFCVVVIISLVILGIYYIEFNNINISNFKKLTNHSVLIFAVAILFLLTLIFYTFVIQPLFKLISENYKVLELKNAELIKINEEVERTLKFSSSLNHELSRSNVELSIKENENNVVQEEFRKSLLIIQESKIELEKTNKLFQIQREDLYDLYNNAPTGYFTLDKNGNITTVNKTALYWIGYTQDEVNENPKFENYIAESSKNDYLKAIDKAIIAGKFVNILLSAIHKEGYEIEFSLNAYTLYDDKNEVSKIRCTCFDMREQIKQEKELKKAIILTENANNAKTEFLNMLSHELRTPIYGIIGNSSLLRNSILNQIQQNYVSDIEKNSDYLSKMIQNILDYIKLDSHKIEFSYNLLNINQIITSSIEKSRLKVNNEQVDISISIDPMIDNNLVSDDAKLEQALIEIITNSLIFTKSGKISIIITQTRFSNTIYRLHFEIIDTGIGIEEDDLKTIFIPFKQISESHIRKSGGTGLGLALTQKIILALNGQIKVKSKIGEGTSVQFFVEAKNKSIELSKKKSRINTYILYKKPSEAKILIAEDTDMNQILLQSMLKNIGLKADLAIDGLQAIEKATQTFYDIILMDIQMPIKDGITATKEILDFYKSRKIKPIIIAVTANALHGDKEKYIEAGMADCLAKPLKQEQLKDMIGKFFENNSKEKSKFSSFNFNSLIDWTVISQIKETALSLDNDLDKIIFSMAKNDIPTYIKEAETLFLDGKKEDLQKILHKIKGASWSSGLKTLGDTCKEYEDAIRSGKNEIDFITIHQIAQMSFEALESS